VFEVGFLCWQYITVIMLISHGTETHIGMLYQSLMMRPSIGGTISQVKHKSWNCPRDLTKHHAMKAYWGSGDIAPFIL
jgi:hypothetical protein